jgi:hypothetical protein
MTRLVDAELRSLWATRSIQLATAGAVVAGALAAAFGTASELTDLRHAEIVLMTLFTLVAGAGEFQHGTVVWTLLAAPNRPAAALAKLAAAAVLGAAIAVGILAATWGARALKEGGLPAGTGIGKLLVGQLVLGRLSGASGLAAGLALRNLPAAVGAVFTLALLIPLVFEAKHSLDRPLPSLRRALGGRARARLGAGQLRPPAPDRRGRPRTAGMDRPRVVPGSCPSRPRGRQLSRLASLRARSTEPGAGRTT